MVFGRNISDAFLTVFLSSCFVIVRMLIFSDHVHFVHLMHDYAMFMPWQPCGMPSGGIPSKPFALLKKTFLTKSKS